MPGYEGDTYTADIDAPKPETPCECCDCDWTGSFDGLAAIGITCLTPGDPSPAGRCPRCGALAYVVKDGGRQ